MIERKKKLRLIQVSLLLMGFLIIFFTYYGKNFLPNENIIKKETQEKVKRQIAKQSESGDVFFNIEYSGIDLAGNRYILKSKEAYNDKNNKEIVNMKSVKATFYFKDDSTLMVSSQSGIYNNKTLDMSFKRDVKAFYDGSELYAQKAEYSNKKGFLTILGEVKIVDDKGTIVADKLLFDIKNQTLDIASIKKNKINANINLK
ncbi:LPS export ABC transporter periplasmic protein LptC [Pelagibacteraceae bacterium]|nr:LPS export ABC transporter periplasmic protein LptC [Pelagibacteraceae bacterium]